MGAHAVGSALTVCVKPSRGEKDAKVLLMQPCHASYEIAKAPVIVGAPLPQVDGFVFLVLAMIKVQSVRRKPGNSAPFGEGGGLYSSAGAHLKPE
jgi:hypothetical protein